MPNILIVDDEQHIRQGLSSSINWAAYGIDSIYTAAKSSEAIRILKEKKVDLVITDVRMPDMTGLEMIRRMQLLSPQVKFIVISGHAEFDYAKEAIRLRVTEYLLKPVNICELIQLVQNTLDLNTPPPTEKTIGSKAAPVAHSSNQTIARLIAYIQANYKRPITLTELSEEMERNPSYISYIFHKETGKKLLDYINEVRIEHALQLIKNSNLMLYEIATMVGFSDYRQFTRSFKKILGGTPAEYLSGIDSAAPPKAHTQQRSLK